MIEWPSCAFQSVERQDQLIFSLLGGNVRNLGARCRVWDSPMGRCGCSAPGALVGRNHTVVEMGANDGLHMSNSYFFSKTLGWRALLVEGNPEVYARIAAHRPEAERVNALVGNPRDFPPKGEATFYSFYRAGDTQKSVTARDWETGLSGIASPNSSNVDLRSAAHAKRYAARYGVQFRQHELKVMRFSALLSQHGIGNIDVLFLDVEGAELSVLQTLNFAKHPVRVLVVERPAPAVLRLLAAHGYEDLRITYDSGGDRVFFNGNLF
jgi:FkbM family methyltransferase